MNVVDRALKFVMRALISLAQGINKKALLNQHRYISCGGAYAASLSCPSFVQSRLYSDTTEASMSTAASQRRQSAEGLLEMFSPRSLVVIGASARRQSSVGRLLLHNVLRGGYTGKGVRANGSVCHAPLLLFPILRCSLLTLF